MEYEWNPHILSYLSMLCSESASINTLAIPGFCFSKIQTGFTFLVPAHLGIPEQRAVKRVCVCLPSLAFHMVTR